MKKLVAQNCIVESGPIHTGSVNTSYCLPANLSSEFGSEGDETALRRDDLSAHCIAHFDTKYKKSEGCWLWTAGKYQKGYGQIAIGRREDGRQINNYAHRVMYVLTKGPIPKGLGVLHRCDNPPCVNPDHLFLGTQADNLQDCARKGRLLKSRPWLHKITDAQVREIRQSIESGVALAQRYGVTPATISVIRRGLRRKAA